METHNNIKSGSWASRSMANSRVHNTLAIILTLAIAHVPYTRGAQSFANVDLYHINYHDDIVDDVLVDSDLDASYLVR